MAAPTVVSLFSGCGGLDLGFFEAGFDVRLAVDHDPAAIAVYRHNIAPDALVLDVLDPGFQRALDAVGQCDVLLGGFPCQGFSKAGPKLVNDERNQLYRAMIQALETLRPSVFVAENVDGLVQNYSGSMLRQIVADCAAVGYEVEWRIVDAAWFGVPQHRRRVLIVGRRKGVPSNAFVWPTARHAWIKRNGERPVHEDYPSWSPHLEAPRTLAEALEGLAPDWPDHVVRQLSEKDAAIAAAVRTGQKLCNARHDATSVRTWDVPDSFGETSARERELLEVIVRNRRHRRYGSIPNGNPLSIEVLRGLFDPLLRREELDSLVKRRFLKVIGDRWDVSGAMFASGLYKRPLLDRPSPTVLTVFANARYFLHPTADRGFTPREVARLQTFPDTFEFEAAGVSAADAFRLVGNAVPPLLARQLADAVLAIFATGAYEHAA